MTEILRRRDAFAASLDLTPGEIRSLYRLEARYARKILRIIAHANIKDFAT